MFDKNSKDIIVYNDNNHDNKLSKSKLGIGIFLGFAYIFIIPVFVYLFLGITLKMLKVEIDDESLSTIAQFISAIIVIIAMLIITGPNLKVILKDLVRDKSIGMAIIFTISIIVFSIMYTILVADYVDNTTANQEQVNNMMVTMPFLAITFVVIIAPLVEEFTFRYFTFNGLKHLMNPKLAILITTVLFAGVHLIQSVIMGTLANDLILFPLYLIPSFLITYSYYKTNMLAVPLLIHIGFNGYQTVMFYLGLFLQEQLDSLSDMVSSVIKFIF